MNKNYITTIDKIDPKYHRSHVIIHDGMWHFADMNDMSQLNKLADTLGFTFTLEEEKKFFNGGNYSRYSMNREIVNGKGFWSVDELPADAKQIKALSNGSIVDCYFTNNGETITIYRPNPNAKNVYQPLSTPDHISHCKKFGTY